MQYLRFILMSGIVIVLALEMSGTPLLKLQMVKQNSFQCYCFTSTEHKSSLKSYQDFKVKQDNFVAIIDLSFHFQISVKR